MTKNIEECSFYHRLCRAGCTKVACHSKFPESAPLIMENHQYTCQHLTHLDCERYKEGLVFQQERRDAHRGCEFLQNKICGKPNQFWCHGSVPPFIIEKDNFLSACFEAGYKACPNYEVGMKFRELARIKSSRTQ